MSPRRLQMIKFENQGIKIKECKKIFKNEIRIRKHPYL
jgi:hypothetical protein